MATAPSTPTLLTQNGNVIDVTFNTNQGDPSPEIVTISVVVYTNPGRVGFPYLTYTAAQIVGQPAGVYKSALMTLPTNVPLYIFSTVLDTRYLVPNNRAYSAGYYQFQYSSPVSPTEIPYVAQRTLTTITVNVDTQGQTGLPPVTYTIQASIQPDFSSFIYNQPATLVSGSIYGSTPFVFNTTLINYIRVISSSGTSTATSPVLSFDPTAAAPPSGPTTVPVLVGTPTSTSITVSYSTAGITGSPTLVSQCFASLSPTGPFDIGCAETLVSPNVFNATASGLAPNTIYYFRTTMSNGVLPNQDSAVSLPLLTEPPPSQLIPPSVPYLVAVGGNGQITVNFQTFPVPSLAATYIVIYSQVNNPDAPGSTNTTFNVEGDIWGSGPFGAFNTGTDWFIFARATSENQTATSGGFRYNSGDAGPPSGPTSTPTLLQSTNTTITVGFNTLGITGNIPFEPVCNASLSATGPFTIACDLTLVAPDTYAATADQLTSNTAYYFQTLNTNGILPNQLSAVSPPFSTTNVAATNPPFATSIEATQMTLRFTVPLSSFVPNVSTAGTIFWGTTSITNNATNANYLGIVQGQPTWEATLFGLTAGRDYYLQSQYYTFPRSLLVVLRTDLGNAFDLGYMPSRGWATPNPVIVGGVSQPWRQT